MKTMEEKAKAYDEAVNKLRRFIEQGVDPLITRADVQDFFPELKESEDERIKKEIIEQINLLKSATLSDLRDKQFNSWIAWLEKQGKQKQLYIRFGDIPSNEKSKIYRGEEEIGDENGVSVYPAFELNGNIVLGLTLPITRTTLYTQQHLLEYDNRPCYLVSGDYIGKDIDGQPLINNVSIIKKIDSYRVKEENQNGQEKDILEDAILDGYILDGNEDGLIAETIKYKNEKQSGKKPAWSEEDERLCQCLIEDQEEALDKVNNDKYGHSEIISDLKEMYHERIDWLKSLQDKVPPKQEWSEENEKMLEYALDMIEWYSGKNEDKSRLVSNWLKSLKGRVQPRQEWSDVDKDILFRIIDDLKFLRDTVSMDPKYAVNIIDMEREITWLNSLRPQNKWKPSDEQMEALDWQVENTSVSSWQYKATKELMEDLKKLKEE